LAEEELLGERVLDRLVEHAREGTGAEGGVEALLGEERAAGVGQLERDLLGRQLGAQLGQHLVDDLAHDQGVERPESEAGVETVAELGGEQALDRAVPGVLAAYGGSRARLP